MKQPVPMDVLQSVVELTREELQYPANFMAELADFERNRPNFIEDYFRFLEMCKLKREPTPDDSSI